MFLCWLEEAIVRRVVTLPSKARFSFQEARSAWGNCDWIGSGRMAIDGLKEVQEAVMLIEAGLSTYEKEVRKPAMTIRKFLPSRSVKRWSAAQLVLNRPPGRLRHLNPGCDNQQRRRRVTAELRNLPHIASMAMSCLCSNSPMRGFSFRALAGQLGISRLTDAVSGDSLAAGAA